MDQGRMNSASKFSPSSERKSVSDGMSSSMNNLREEHEEKQRLEKSNFDLKMKVYYLEENLKRYQDGEHAGDAQTEHQRLEIGKLKLQLEDKQVDLEQRNLLLIKSKNAIEALKVEIERLRNENNHQQDLEDRIRRLKQLNEDIENDYRSQINQLEQQLVSARQLADSKEIEKATSEDKVNHLEISFEQIDNHLKDTQQEKNRLHDQLVVAQHKIEALEEEGTQNRAHIDLYRIQMEEAMQERDSFKEKLRQEQLAKLKVDEDGKSRLSDCTKHYESQIRAMRVNHEQDLEKIRAGHMEMLADVRENYQAELGRSKLDLEKAMNEIRSADAQDLNRMKENFTVRIEEKNDEIKSLRGMMNADSQRVDALLHELDATRLQLREKSQLSEKLLVETAAKTEELKVLPRIMKDLEECRVNFASLQKQIQHEQQEKVHFSTQVDQLTAALDSARADLSQRDHSLQSALAEVSRLTRDVSDLSAKADSIEHVSRDNERLKGVVARLETDNLSFTHKVSELKRELERSEEEVSKILADRDSLKDTIRAIQAKLDGAVDHNDAIQVQIQSERERRSATDAALAETRTVLTQCREELQNERNFKLSSERRAQQCEEEMREMRHSLGQACVLSFNAMQEWDETLSIVLDGELFAGFVRNGSTGSNSAALRQLSSPSRGAHARSSPSRGAIHENYEVEQLLAMPTDQLMQRVAVRVERVGIKLQRTEKIRGLFVAQAEKLVDILQQGMQNSQERIALYHHKLVEAQSELQKLRTTVERDRKQREVESEELSQFKEVVRSQHTAQLRDSEIRFAQVTQQLEHEKSRSDELQRQVAAQADELRSLQQINHRMNEDLQVMERTEQIVLDLTNRVGSLGELNRNMSKDIDAKADSIAQLTHDNGELKMELSSLVARSESLLQQVRSRDEAIEASEAKLQGLIREIERLRTRQIHPDLAKTILDTQNILQTAVRSDAPTTLPINAVAPVYSQSSTGAGDRVGEYLNRVDQLEGAASNLIQRTSEMVASFEAHMGNTRSTMTRGAAALTAIKQELYELLDANSTLAVQVQQLVAEFKKSIRQLNLSLSSHDSLETSHSGRNSSSHRAPISPIAPSSLRKMDDSPASKFGSLSLHSPIRLEGVIEPHYTSAIRGHASSAAMSTTQRLGEYSSAVKPPQSPEAYGSHAKSARFQSSPATGASVNELSRTSYDLPARIGGYQPSASLSASMAAYTPNTASRLSTNRLNKLGSDLEALARKLDSYDTSRTK